MDAHGKHLFLRFEGDLTLHSHLRMGGAWGVYRRGQRWRRSPRRAWLVIRTREHEVVQFDGPVLELMTDSRTRFDQRLARLGPDVLADEFDAAAFLRRLREDDPRRGIADALLDQRNLAGIGNLWKAEACFLAGVNPWQPVAEVPDELALELVEGIRPLMRRPPRAAFSSATRGSSSATGARAGAAERSSAHAARATTTAPPTGARAASRDPRRPQGRRPRGARQHRSRASRPPSSTAWT